MAGLMGVKEAAPPPPPPEPTPMADEEAIKRAKQRAMKRSAGRTGRGSTMLSGGYASNDMDKSESMGGG